MAGSSHPKKAQRKLNSSSSERKIGHNKIGCDKAHRPKQSGRGRKHQKLRSRALATVNQHPPVHHPMDEGYDSIVDEPQLSY